MSSRRITIFDTTLRDGIALRPDEKVEIGEQLERLGVDAPRSRAHIFIATSALQMEKKLRLRPDEVVAQAVQEVTML